MAMAGNKKTKVDISGLVDSLVGTGRKIGNLGREMGKVANAAREFNEAVNRVGSVIDRDVRQGAIDELFSDPGVKLSRRSARTRSDRRRTDGLLDEADPRVDTTVQDRTRRVAETLASTGITAEEANAALSGAASGMRGETTPETGSGAQGPGTGSGRAKTDKVKEERCKIGERKFRTEDNSGE